MPAAVRPVTRADVPALWSLIGELAEYERLTDILTGTPALLEQALFGPGDRVRGLIAEHTGTGPAVPVGYALFYPVFSSFRTRWRLWLEDVYVQPGARGTGAGLALMRALARHAVEGGYTAIDWEVLDWNRIALEFYDRLGAVQTGQGWLRYRLDGEALRAAASGGRG